MSTSSERYAKYIKLILYLVVIVLINVAGITLFFRGDLTENKIFSLSEVSKKVVSTLSEPLTVKVFFTKDLPAPHNNTEQYLRDLLKEYSISGNQYFNYRFYNVSEESEGISSEDSGTNRMMASDYGINPVQIQVVEQDEIKFKKAFMGLVLIHGDIIERIPTITSTDGLEYKLTSAIQKLNNKVSALLNLEDKIQVKLVLSSSIYDVASYMGIEEVKSYPDKIKQIVADMNPKLYNRLDYSYVDPAKDPQAAKEIETLDVLEISWPAIEDAGVKPGRGRIGLVVQYGDDARIIPLLNVIRLPIFGTRYQLTDAAAAEEQINASVERLAKINMDLGYLADYGTLPTVGPGPMAPQTEETLSIFNSLISRNYSLKPVNLKETGIAEGIKCLVIARPREKFSDYALYQIDQALMHGTNIAVFADILKENRPPGQQPFMANQMATYVPVDTGLEKLLAHYGVRIKKSLVLDENSYHQRLPQEQGGGERPIYFIPKIQNEFINKELDYIKNIRGFYAIKMSPLELDAKSVEAQGIKAYELFGSSNRSWEMRKNISMNPMLQIPPQESEMTSLPLAYLLEGSFTSYFKDKPMPEKPVEKKEDAEENTEETAESGKDLSDITEKGAFKEKSPPAKIFVVGSAEILKDQLLDDQGQSTNSMFILNVIDALNDREAMATMRSKSQQYNPLAETTPATKNIIKAFNIAGLPILVVIFGLIVWWRRQVRRKKIQLQFES